MTREQFRREAASLSAELLGHGAIVLAQPRELSNFVGWKGQGVGFVYCAGRPLRAVVTVTVTPEGWAGWPER